METFCIFVMTTKFEIKLLEAADVFLSRIDGKVRKRLFYAIDRAKWANDPKFFKKFDADIWEFRAESNRVQYRLFRLLGAKR